MPGKKDFPFSARQFALWQAESRKFSETANAINQFHSRFAHEKLPQACFPNLYRLNRLFGTATTDRSIKAAVDNARNLEEDITTIIALVGLPGTGKTNTFLRILEELLKKVPAATIATPTLEKGLRYSLRKSGFHTPEDLQQGSFNLQIAMENAIINPTTKIVVVESVVATGHDFVPHRKKPKKKNSVKYGNDRGTSPFYNLLGPDGDYRNPKGNKRVELWPWVLTIGESFKKSKHNREQGDEYFPPTNNPTATTAQELLVGNPTTPQTRRPGGSIEGTQYADTEFYNTLLADDYKVAREIGIPKPEQFLALYDDPERRGMFIAAVFEFVMKQQLQTDEDKTAHYKVIF